MCNTILVSCFFYFLGDIKKITYLIFYSFVQISSETHLITSLPPSAQKTPMKICFLYMPSAYNSLALSTSTFSLTDIRHYNFLSVTEQCFPFHLGEKKTKKNNDATCAVATFLPCLLCCCECFWEAQNVLYAYVQIGCMAVCNSMLRDPVE